jgi:hypothetical protein
MAKLGLLATLVAAALVVGHAAAAVNNTVTQWEDLAQAAVRAYGIQNQLSTRWAGGRGRGGGRGAGG